MNIIKRKISYGHYQILRDGTLAAVVTKLVDSGEPIWGMSILDDTPITTLPSGRQFPLDNFKTLADAVSYYGYCVKEST